MEIKLLEDDFSVCKIRDLSGVNLTDAFYFIGKTDEELSLVCRTEHVPEETTDREDGWKAFRIEGVLDFSLIGILAEISAEMCIRDSRYTAVPVHSQTVLPYIQ